MAYSSNVVALTARTKKRPSIENGKVPPLCRKNSELRSREYLTSSEVDKLCTAARKVGRHGHRDSTLIMTAFRHGLRVSELVALRWESVDLRQGLLHVSRIKNGVNSTHPLRRPELRALRKLKKDHPETPYVFVTERKGPLTASNVRKIVSRAGENTELGMPIHPHMLRHSTGFYLANDGHDTRAIQLYLGHKNIQHTVLYTELAPNRFKGLWKD